MMVSGYLSAVALPRTSDRLDLPIAATSRLSISCVYHAGAKDVSRSRKSRSSCCCSLAVELVLPRKVDNFAIALLLPPERREPRLDPLLVIPNPPIFISRNCRKWFQCYFGPAKDANFVSRLIEKQRLTTWKAAFHSSRILFNSLTNHNVPSYFPAVRCPAATANARQKSLGQE